MHAAHASTVLRFARKERAATELDDIDQLVHRYGARLLRFVAFSIGDQQFTGLLSGDYTADANRHMQACTQCQGEFERVQASIEDFVTLSLEWAERRASTSISAPSLFLRGWYSASSWAAAAAVLAAAILLGVHQGRLLSPEAISVASSQPAESPSEVAADNRLLMAIDKEIRWQTESPISIDDLTTSAGRPHAQPSRGLTTNGRWPVRHWLSRGGGMFELSPHLTRVCPEAGGRWPASWWWHAQRRRDAWWKHAWRITPGDGRPRGRS